MTQYQLQYRKTGLVLAAAIVVAGAAYFVLSESPEDDQNSIGLSIQQDEVMPGDTVRIEASDSEGEPVEGVEITVNSEDIGATNVNGIAGYSIPESAENLSISAEFQGQTAVLEASLDGEYFDLPEEGSNGSGSEDGNSDDGQNEDDQNEDENNNSDPEDGSNNETDNNESTGSESGEEREGLSLEEDPVAGELNTVTIYENNETVETTVYINNDEIGTTSSTGTLTFTVPNTQEITVSADADVDSETFEVEGYSNESNAGEPEEDPEVLNAYYQYTPENPSIGNEIEFKASQSTGNNLQSYEWNFGNGETATGETVNQAYEEPGTYTVELTVTDGEGNTDSIDADITVEDTPTPDIQFNEPKNADYEEYESETLDFEFDIYNAVEDAEYTIYVDGNSKRTGTLQPGENGQQTVTEENVEIGEGETQAYIEIEQGLETFTSETKTILSGQTVSEPQFTLDSPTGTLETFDNETNVEFTYTIEDRGWAEQASLILEDEEGNEVDSYSHSITSGETYNYEFEDVPASEEGEEYEWNLSLQNEDNILEQNTQFLVEKIEPDFDAEINNLEVKDNGYEISVEISIISDLESQIIFLKDGNEFWSNTIRDDPYEGVLEFEREIPEAGEHEAKVWIENIDTGEIKYETEVSAFETTEDRPSLEDG